MKDKTDLELCEMYKAGNEEAFEVLWERYKRITFRIINKQKYLLINFDKEDLLNECAIKMLFCINKYDESNKFITLYTAAINNFFLMKARVMQFDCQKLTYQATRFSDLKSHYSDSQECDILDLYLGGNNDVYETDKKTSTLMDCLNKGLALVKSEYREYIFKRIIGEIEKDEDIARVFGTTRQTIQWNRRKVENYVKENYEGEAV